MKCPRLWSVKHKCIFPKFVSNCFELWTLIFLAITEKLKNSGIDFRQLGKMLKFWEFPGYRLSQPILSNWFLTVASLPPNDIVTEPLLATVSSCSSVSVIKEMIYWQLNFWENFRIVRQWTRFKMSIIRLDVWCMDPNRMSMASIAVLNGRYLE